MRGKRITICACLSVSLKYNPSASASKEHSCVLSNINLSVSQCVIIDWLTPFHPPVRWAGEQAKKRELGDVVDFVRDLQLWWSACFITKEEINTLPVRGRKTEKTWSFNYGCCALWIRINIILSCFFEGKKLLLPFNGFGKLKISIISS
jgi:hypothetical protein